MTIKKENLITREIREALSNKRLDIVLAETFPEYSRSRLKKWLENNLVSVNQRVINKPSHKIIFPAKLELSVPNENLTEDLPEQLDLNIVESTEGYVVIDKSHGMVVHPGAGNKSGTLLNALLHEYPELKKLPRAGIVHRLDKDTSGLMVISKTESAYLNLTKQLKERTVKRTYLALVVGTVITGKTIDRPIGRHPKVRTKQAVISSGKEAITKFSVSESYEGYSLLKVNLKTGRTHQIRVHLSHEGFPIIGDPTYGTRNRFSPNTSEQLKKIISTFGRQALHAAELELIHPVSKDLVNFKAEMPEDMKFLRDQIKNGC